MALTEPERLLIAAARALIGAYAAGKLLKEGATRDGLIRGLHDDIDRRWLRAGQGRSVTWKNALPVFDAYDSYVARARAEQGRASATSGTSDAPA